jgi:hypothetical protein
MADYFPADLIKTAELPRDKNYIFCCHPHGLLSVATFVNFCTNATDFSEKFPGIKSYPASLAAQFYYPFRREIIAALGVISASARSIAYILRRGDGGNAVCLVIGGAEEAVSLRDFFLLSCSKKKKIFLIFYSLPMMFGSNLKRRDKSRCLVDAFGGHCI